MNARGVAIQGGLAALVLVGAYATWQRAPEMSTGEVFVLDLTKNDLEKVRFEDGEGKSWSELSKGKDAEGSFATCASRATTARAPPCPPGTRAFRSSCRSARCGETKRGATTRAVRTPAGHRALGVLDGAKLKELGLERRRRSSRCRGAGSRGDRDRAAPPGGTDPYIKDLQDNKVYIVPRPLLSDMQSAQTNLVERRLHAFRIEEIERVSYHGRGDQEGAHGEPHRRVSRHPPHPDRDAGQARRDPEELARSHLQPLPDRGAGQGRGPAAGAAGGGAAARVPRPRPEPRLGRAGPQRDARRLGHAGASTPHEVFARSEFTAGWIKLSTDAQNLLTEGEGLLTKK